MTRRLPGIRRALPAALALLALAGPAAAQQTHILIVTGLSGDPAYAEQFHGWAATLIDAAAERYELPGKNNPRRGMFLTNAAPKRGLSLISGPRHTAGERQTQPTWVT